jgi:RHS repeat-associated protein
MVFVYDAFGNIAAEYTTAASGATGTQYVITDHLGSTRLVLGNTTERHDYLPFGNEETSTGNWRSGVAGYGPETVRQMFAGEERDSSDSYLDFLQARYLSSVQGRFMSPDPGNAGPYPSSPQSWNGYGYVGNGPLTFTDPSGLDPGSGGGPTPGGGSGGHTPLPGRTNPLNMGSLGTLGGLVGALGSCGGSSGTFGGGSTGCPFVFSATPQNGA